MAQNITVKRYLYGGALSLELPCDFSDLSKYRDVPSTQEFYIDSTGRLSFVFDILEQVDLDDDFAAAKINYEEILSINECSSGSIVSIQQIFLDGEKYIDKRIQVQGTQTSNFVPRAFLVRGVMYVERKSEGELIQEKVEPLMALIRLNNVQADLVITLNCSNSNQENNLLEDIILTAVKSLTILDWSLFITS